jgi:methionyl aminopeptidase
MRAREQKQITIKSPEEIALMRRAGAIVAEMLEETRKAAKPGVTTNELDAIAEDVLKRRGAQSAFKGYLGYRKVICTSINEELVHGIPGNRVIKTGDLVSVDAGAVWKGWYGDAAVTFAVGEVSDDAKKLIEVTRKALETGIAAAKPGVRLGDVSHAIQEYIEGHGFGVVQDYVGHGIGRQMHEPPSVPNFGSRDRGILLRKGFCIAIEPMVTVGDWHTKVHDDGWTVSTVDGSLCAHFEHSIAIMDDGAEILTLPQ